MGNRLRKTNKLIQICILTILLIILLSGISLAGDHKLRIETEGDFYGAITIYRKIEILGGLDKTWVYWGTNYMSSGAWGDNNVWEGNIDAKKIYLHIAPGDAQFLRWEKAATGTSKKSPHIKWDRDKTVKAVFKDITINDVTFPDDPIKTIQGGAALQWNELDDPSGIDKYQIRIIKKDGGEIVKSKDVKAKTQKTITGLSSKYSYYADVRAIDNAGNVSNWTEAGQFSPLSEPTEFISVSPQSEKVSGQPRYKMELKIKEVDAETYVFQRAETGTEYWKDIAEVPANQMTKFGNELIYIDDHYLEKHKKYDYRVTTKNIQGDLAEQSNGNIYYNYIREQKVANIQAEFKIIGPDDNVNIRNKENTINIISNEINSKKDCEGDNLKFKVWYKKENKESWNSNGEFTDHPIDINFASDGVWEWYIEVKEYDESLNFETTYTTDKRTLKIDTIDPDGEFVIQNIDGNIEYTQDNPTNTSQVNLPFSNLTDELGVVDSGVEEIYFWNGESEPDAFYGIGEVLTNDSQLNSEKAIEIAECNKGVCVTSSYLYGKDYSWWENWLGYEDIDPISSIPWRLAYGSDGNRVVNMKIKDGAGNTTTKTKTVLLDRTNPATPTVAGYSHISSATEDAAIEFTCRSNSDDVERFSGRYYKNGTWTSFNLSANQEQDGTEISKVRTINIPVDDLGANQEVKVEVEAIDRAGNKSDVLSFSAYTKAELGMIEARDGGYDETLKHYLRWQLTNSGIAKTHKLECGTMVEGEFEKEDEIKLDDNGFFTHSEINPHGEYYYRLVAFNQLDDRTVGQVFSRKVPNTEPEAPVINSPVEYARDEIEFNFEPADDVDNDVPSYNIYFAEGKNPTEDSFEQIAANISKDAVITKGNLVHNQGYTWYVEADDGEGGLSTSNRVSFTVDTDVPLLEVEDATKPFTNQQQLTVTASDSLSGIKNNEISYKRLDSNTNQVIEEEKITLSQTEGTGIIPLVEGEYHLFISVYDNAGNESKQELKNLKVDHTKPVISNMILDLEQDSGQYLSSSGQLPIRLTASDNLAQLKGIRYWVVNNSGDELNQEGSFISLSPTFEQYSCTLNLADISNQEYYLAVAVEDRADNRSEVEYIGPIYIDKTAPQLSLDLTGLNSYGGSYYLTDLNQLEADVNAIDEESGITATQYALIVADTEDIVVNWSDWSVVKNAAMLAGEKYRVLVKTTNGVGSSTIVKSDEFIYDSTAPGNLSLTEPTTALIEGEMAEFKISAQDNQSSIVEYRLAIGLEAGATDFSKLIPGNEDGWLILNTDNPGFRIKTPEVADGNYYPTVEVVNAAGLTATLEGSPFSVDNNQEKVIVGDRGPYTMFTNQLTGWWDYNGASEVVGYRYRIVDEGNNEVIGWTSTEKTETIVTGLNLNSGVEYSFEVQAEYADGNYSASKFSPGVVVDGTEPEITELITPEYSTSWNLEVDWAGNDTESGIRKVEVALGSDYYLTDITKGWVELAENRLSCDTNGDKLNLQTGEQYYLTLRLVNGAGLQKERVAEAIVIDDTKPPVPVVRDQGSFINTHPDQDLTANWIWTPRDKESGTVDYKWAILEYGEDINTANWHESSGELKLSLSYEDFAREHGKTYYFAVKAINGSGLSSVGLSDGIMVDETAPFIPELKLLEAINLGNPDAEEVNYITNNEELGLWIDSVDPESDIKQYLYTWGDLAEVDNNTRSESDSSQIEVDNLEVSEGEVTVFAGETINNADDMSATGYSTGVMLDKGAPIITDVRGSVSGNELLFDWDVEVSVSPVAGYEAALVREENMDSVPASEAWVSNGLSRSISLDGSDLEDGNYRLLVRGYNEAGTYSRREGELDEWGVSPKIVLDRTEPQIKKFNYDQYVSSEIEVEVEAEDNLSGINSYQYALGTRINPTEFSKGWIDIEENRGWLEFNVPTQDVPHNTEVYLMVRAKDNVGLWSQAEVSQRIIVDHTKPYVSSLSCGDYTANENEIKGIEFTADDFESGVTHYMLSIVNEIGEEWLTTPEPTAIEEFDGQLTNLQLEDGEDYYLVIKTKNAAGLWSETKFSNPIIVDITPPEVSLGQDIVFNERDIPGTIEYSLSENANVDFTVTAGDGTSKEFSYSKESGINTFLFKETKPDTYIVTAIPTDPAGNIGEEKTQMVRVNNPPQINLPDVIETTPGKPVELTAEVTDVDSNDDPTLYQYEWIPGDDGNDLTGNSPTYAYDELGDYTLTLKVTDNDGGTGVAKTKVKVRNTAIGQLYADEVWSGEHHIFGSVTVPEGFNLTILPGTEIIIDGIPGDTGYNHALIIDGSLTIDALAENVTFISVLEDIGAWKGIYIEGQADLVGVNIQHACRGVTIVDNAGVNIDDSIFENNKVGVHTYNAAPIISNTFFENNSWYGIKEDHNSNPTVINCSFIVNGVNYYHQELSRITIEELNEIDGNYGNQ